MDPKYIRVSEQHNQHYDLLQISALSNEFFPLNRVKPCMLLKISILLISTKWWISPDYLPIEILPYYTVN